MDGYTIFKNLDGAFFGVSDRVVDAGYNLKEGIVYASDEEVAAFEQRATKTRTKEERLAGVQAMLNKKLITEEVFNTHVENISNEPELVEEVVPEPVEEVIPESVVEIVPEPVLEVATEKKVSPFLLKLIKEKQDKTDKKVEEDN